MCHMDDGLRARQSAMANGVPVPIPSTQPHLDTRGRSQFRDQGRTSNPILPLKNQTRNIMDTY